MNRNKFGWPVATQNKVVQTKQKTTKDKVNNILRDTKLCTLRKIPHSDALENCENVPPQNKAAPKASRLKVLRTCREEQDLKIKSKTTRPAWKPPSAHSSLQKPSEAVTKLQQEKKPLCSFIPRQNAAPFSLGTKKILKNQVQKVTSSKPPVATKFEFLPVMNVKFEAPSPSFPTDISCIELDWRDKSFAPLEFTFTGVENVIQFDFRPSTSQSTPQEVSRKSTPIKPAEKASASLPEKFKLSSNTHNKNDSIEEPKTNLYGITKPSQQNGLEKKTSKQCNIPVSSLKQRENEIHSMQMSRPGKNLKSKQKSKLLPTPISVAQVDLPVESVKEPVESVKEPVESVKELVESVKEPVESVKEHAKPEHSILPVQCTEAYANCEKNFNVLSLNFDKSDVNENSSILPVQSAKELANDEPCDIVVAQPTKEGVNNELEPVVKNDCELSLIQLSGSSCISEELDKHCDIGLKSTKNCEDKFSSLLSASKEKTLLETSFDYHSVLPLQPVTTTILMSKTSRNVKTCNKNLMGETYLLEKFEVNRHFHEQWFSDVPLIEDETLPEVSIDMLDDSFDWASKVKRIPQMIQEDEFKQYRHPPELHGLKSSVSSGREDALEESSQHLKDLIVPDDLSVSFCDRFARLHIKSKADSLRDSMCPTDTDHQDSVFF